MTKPELLREIGIHLKKVVDVYNQLAKHPDAFTPGEIDQMVNNAAKIIEYAAVVKHQPASAANNDEQIKLRDLEDKLRVMNEQLKNKEFEIDRLAKINRDLEQKVEESRHLVDTFAVDIPEVVDKQDSNSTLAKNDLLSDSLQNKIPEIEELIEEKKVEKQVMMDLPSFTMTEKKEISLLDMKHENPQKSLLSKYEDETEEAHKKTVISALNESIIDGSKENVAEKMMNTKVVDLKKVIPLHEKFMYASELFGKNSDHYSQFIDAMNTKQNWKEAEALLAQAASMYKWDPENKTALQFIALIQRRFD